MNTQTAAPGVTFMLGPPRDPGQRALFEAFQAPAGTAAGEAPWIAAERDAIAWLFESGGDGGSIAEQCFREAGGMELRFGMPYLAIGRHRGQAVVTVTLKQRHVRAANDVKVAWPPSRITIRRVAEMLQYILEREWIGVLVT